MNPDEELILPETDNIVHDEPVPPKKSHKNSLVFMIISIVAFLGLAGSLVYIFIGKSEPAPEISDSSENVSYDNDKIEEVLSRASERYESGDYLAAEYVLENFPAVERMTNAQKYRYYSILANVNSSPVKNDPELAAKYSALAEESRQAILKGEE